MSRYEPHNLPPMVVGECEWCGEAIPKARKYCCPDHRSKYNNQLAIEGKRAMQALKLWARWRGRANTPGAEAFQVLRSIGDDSNREARDRKAGYQRPQNTPNPASGHLCAG